jgi:hypothetical protein
MRNEEKHEWDRQSGESSKAYAHFCLYRDMGVTRSIRQMPSVSGCTSVVRQLNRWSSRWKWVERCQRYDDHLEQEERLQQEKERREMHKRHAKVALLGMNVAVKGLESLLTKVQSGEGTVAPGDLTRLLETSARIELRARGEPTESHELSGPGGGPVKLDLGETLKRIDEVYGLKTEEGSGNTRGPGNGSGPSEP